MEDSSGLLADPPNLKARFDRDGCLLIRGLVDSDAVLALHEAIVSVLRQHGSHPDSATWHEASARRWAYTAGVQRLEEFHALAHSPPLVNVTRTLVGADAFVRPLRAFRAVWPHVAGLTTPPHHDFQYNRGTQRAVTAWVPLNSCPPRAGGLRLLLGSHRAGPFRVKSYDALVPFGVDVAGDDPGWATATYEPGDVVIFDALAIHASLPNESEALRLSVDYRYQPASEPIARPSMHPLGHVGGEVPDWAELLDGVGWDTARWVSPPAGLRVVEFRAPS